MFSERLNKLREHVEQWCSDHSIPAASITDTLGIQGIKIYNRDQEALSSLLSNIKPLLEADQVYLDIQKVRGGLLLAFSVQALSEQQVQQFIAAIGEEPHTMNLKDRLDLELLKPIIKPQRSIEDVAPLSFNDLAKKIVEDQYKDPLSGMERSNQTSRQRNLSTVMSTYAGKIPGRNPKGKGKLAKAKSVKEAKNFDAALLEALDGIATPGVQPADLFARFSAALKQLGQSMGVGPLQDKLKEKGIRYKKSKDGQAIILYVINASTNAPQPIARISADTLNKPHDFEEQLIQMIDFAKGEAPGAFKQKQEELRDQEKAARDIAKSVIPQMGDEGAGQQPPAAPAKTVPQAPVASAVPAATQAATPKPMTKVPTPA